MLCFQLSKMIIFVHFKTLRHNNLIYSKFLIAHFMSVRIKYIGKRTVANHISIILLLFILNKYVYTEVRRSYFRKQEIDDISSNAF